tara:strand:- start:15 stop:221 length:207 start_codon:yes stop_codon:yes gene_type:complete
MIIPIEKKDLGPLRFIAWLNFLLSLIILTFLIVDHNSPNKHITPEQEKKLTEATTSMKEVADFIKRHD